MTSTTPALKNYLEAFEKLPFLKTVSLGAASGIVSFYTKSQAFVILDKILKEVIANASSNNSINSTLYSNVPQLLLLFTASQLSSLILKKIADNIDSKIKSSAIEIDQELSQPHKLNAVRKYSSTYSKDLTDYVLYLRALNTKGYDAIINIALTLYKALSSAASINKKFTMTAQLSLHVLNAYINWKIDAAKQPLLQEIKKTQDAIVLAENALSNPDFASIAYINNNILARHKAALQKRLLEQESGLFKYYVLTNLSSLVITPLNLAINIATLYQMDFSKDNLALTINTLFQSINAFLDTSKSFLESPYSIPNTDLVGAKKAIALAEAPKTTNKQGISEVEVNNNGKRSKLEYNSSMKKSLQLKGINGTGKSSALKALGGIETPEPLQNETAPAFSVKVTKRHKDAKETAYIPQGSLAGLLEVTKHGNPAGITPIDLFTAFFSEHVPDITRRDSKNECARLIEKLNITPFKGKDLSKPIDFAISPSGGEAQQIKYVMLSVTALYDNKALILVDEIYNDLAVDSRAIVEGEFTNLVNNLRVKTKFISVDHRDDKEIGDGVYHAEKLDMKVEEQKGL